MWPSPLSIPATRAGPGHHAGISPVQGSRHGDGKGPHGWQRIQSGTDTHGSWQYNYLRLIRDLLAYGVPVRMPVLLITRSIQVQMAQQAEYQVVSAPGDDARRATDDQSYVEHVFVSQANVR